VVMQRTARSQILQTTWKPSRSWRIPLETDSGLPHSRGCALSAPRPLDSLEGLAGSASVIQACSCTTLHHSADMLPREACALR
jgi:hypothetical protein